MFFLGFFVTDCTLSFLTYVDAVGIYLINLILVFVTCITPKVYTTYAFNYAVKTIITISLLIFIRGGIPRYRYDFLTKLGWIKFLSWVLSFFIINLLIVFIS